MSLRNMKQMEEWNYSYIHSLSRHCVGADGHLHVPAALTPRKEPSCAETGPTKSSVPWRRFKFLC